MSPLGSPRPPHRNPAGMAYSRVSQILCKIPRQTLRLPRESLPVCGVRPDFAGCCIPRDPPFAGSGDRLLTVLLEMHLGCDSWVVDTASNGSQG
ncbi:hypothetical protein CDAR_223301 [Caerostris darwini]|uniref:Uncharacterized protein n=1 Tax=Caerostris darwini TaxID=1538125 RepID=A0AAV4W5Y6_9ARAC|nr:hypothetical protein CDAR_223301 [Caerostris darwini]